MPRARKYPLQKAACTARRAWCSSQDAQSPPSRVICGNPPQEMLPASHVRRVEADEGMRKDTLSSDEHEEIKALRRENYELRRANEILEGRQRVFAGELDPHRPR